MKRTTQQSTPIKIEFIKPVYWDNWGRIVRVFNKGDVVTATKHSSGKVSAESTIYEGVSDFVYAGDYIEIESI